jgi:hypothetical protein
MYSYLFIHMCIHWVTDYIFVNIYIYTFGPVGTVSGLIYWLVSIHCPMGWMIFLSRGVSLLECEQSTTSKKAYWPVNKYYIYDIWFYFEYMIYDIYDIYMIYMISDSIIVVVTLYDIWFYYCGGHLSLTFNPSSACSAWMSAWSHLRIVILATYFGDRTYHK